MGYGTYVTRRDAVQARSLPSDHNNSQISAEVLVLMPHDEVEQRSTNNRKQYSTCIGICLE